MTRRDIVVSLTLAASMVFAMSVQAAQLGLPGEPEIDETTAADCDRTVPPDEPLAHGRIVAVDPRAGRITLDYRPILPLLPEGGRRIFHVAAGELPSGLGPRDKVRFEVKRDGHTYTVTHIENSN